MNLTDWRTIYLTDLLSIHLTTELTNDHPTNDWTDLFTRKPTIINLPTNYQTDLLTRSRFYESSQQRYANVATVTWLARHFETVKFPITSSPRARPSNWANAELYRYKIVGVSLHKTHICVVKSLVKIAAVSWHSLRRFIKPAPDLTNHWTDWLTSDHPTDHLLKGFCHLEGKIGKTLILLFLVKNYLFAWKTKLFWTKIHHPKIEQGFASLTEGRRLEIRKTIHVTLTCHLEP